jgi:hypothetical protein
MKNLWLKCFCMFLVATLFGCGGGGGGGGGGLTTTIFTDWSSVNPPQIVGFTGLSQDTKFELDPDPATPPFTIPVDEINTTNVTATLRYRADGSIERIDISTPRVALSWNLAAGDIINNDRPLVYAGDTSVLKFGVLYNPLHPAADPWEYQTFGAWADARPIDAGDVGALSVGTPTPGDAIPPLSTATFIGHSAGIYTTSDGTAAYVTESAVSVDVNFFNQELVLNTTGTTLTNIETGTPWTNSPPTLDVTGTLTYAPGVNSFAGPVTANGATGGMTGTSTGQFYGPAAEELGGVFSLTGADGREHYSGAYGAAK